MNVVRFYETLAKIIGEREGVTVTVKVREVTENRTLQTSENSSLPHEDESELRSIHGARDRQDVDHAVQTCRVG